MSATPTRRAALALVAALACSGAAAAETVLRVAMGSPDLGTLDPHLGTNTPDKAIIGWMFNGLVRFPPGSINPDEIEPDLAERWEHSADGLTWTFHLRKGVKFHAGYGELTADDVVFSIQRAATAKTSAFASDYQAIASLKALDPYTVQIVLKNRIPSVLGILTSYQGGNIVSRKAVEALGEGFRTNAIGTGPFAFSEYRNQEVTLVANPAYFRGAPKIDRISYRYIPSDASRDLSFTSGEIDLSFGRNDQRWVERMRAMPDTVVETFGPGELAQLHLNTSRKPLDDIKLRQALAHGINRDELVRFRGASVFRPAVSVTPIGYTGTDDKAPLPQYDPVRAKALLAEAGYKDGLTIRMVASSLPTQLSAMEVVQAQLKRIGVQLDLNVVDHATYHSMIRKDLSDIVYYGAARFPVADAYLTPFFHSRSIIGTPQAVTNFSHCSVADAEIDAARGEPDAAKQRDLWKTAQHKLIENVCSVPLIENTQVWVHRTNLDLGYELKASLTLGPLITEKTELRRR